MMATNPPAVLWRKTGNYPDGSVASIEVKVCLDPKGNLWSFNQPMSSKDDGIFSSWKGGGVRAITHAMLTEAVRREAYMCVLAQLTKDGNFVQTYANGDPSIRSAMEVDLARVVRETLEITLPKMIPDAAREVLDMVAKQDGKGPPNA
jgi:hypothetical protein